VIHELKHNEGTYIISICFVMPLNASTETATRISHIAGVFDFIQLKVEERGNEASVIRFFLYLCYINMKFSQFIQFIVLLHKSLYYTLSEHTCYYCWVRTKKGRKVYKFVI